MMWSSWEVGCRGWPALGSCIGLAKQFACWNPVIVLEGVCELM